jgi:hypothetical protein
MHRLALSLPWLRKRPVRRVCGKSNWCQYEGSLAQLPLPVSTNGDFHSSPWHILLRAVDWFYLFFKLSPD